MGDRRAAGVDDGSWKGRSQEGESHREEDRQSHGEAEEEGGSGANHARTRGEARVQRQGAVRAQRDRHRGTERCAGLRRRLGGERKGALAPASVTCARS